jgi:hypothetical protein
MHQHYPLRQADCANRPALRHRHGFNAQNRLERDGANAFAISEFRTGEECAAGIRSCRAIGDKGSIDAIGSAILLGVGAGNRPNCSQRPKWHTARADL